MIIVQLKGGLGNQLFQYAAGLSLAKHHQVDVKVDVTELMQADQKIGTLRNYELQHLLSPPEVATNEEIEELIKQGITRKYYQKLLPSHQRKIYNEKKIRYDPDFFNAGSHVYLKGYRQSEKYFLPIKKDIFEGFQFQNYLIREVLDFADSLAKTTSISLHIRRGDYANPLVANYHGAVSQSYYQQAIDELSLSLVNPSFYIFSDDVSWAKDTLKFQSEVQFISNSVSQNQYEDFYLMSRCRHNIIANSTFSWWAAWLNPNPEKIVIAPKKWYNKANLDTKDLIPQQWITL